MSTTTTKKSYDLAGGIDTGRHISAGELRRQMGMDWFAVSGGRCTPFGPSAVALPVGQGYWVTVTIEANDTYTVERVFRRNGRFHVRGTQSDVYADQVGESAYRASCYLDAFPA